MPEPKADEYVVMYPIPYLGLPEYLIGLLHGTKLTKTENAWATLESHCFLLYTLWFRASITATVRGTHLRLAQLKISGRTAG